MSKGVKGRVTSFQRFGSALGTTGSVVNKFIRSLSRGTTGRDSERQGDGEQDFSNGKGIYNATLVSGNDLLFDYDDKEKSKDLGEEVYGCIADSIGDGEYIEKDYKEAKGGREKATRDDSAHFEQQKREWYEGKAKKGYEDWAAIPQENVPLNVNSKFPMKYWDNIKKENADIPKGIGFTSGALIRPITFSEQALPIEELNISASTGYRYPHILRDVPINVAHSILNCCKEIKIEGSVSNSIERKGLRCKTWSGGDSELEVTYKKWDEEVEKGCDPWECKDIGGELTASCTSGKQSASIKLTGDIKMTAFRHKQVADIWKDPPAPIILDISGNAFVGTPGDVLALRTTTASGCTLLKGDSINPPPAAKFGIPAMKQILEFEKQTKLSSGCLAYPLTNNSIIIATEGDSLKQQYSNPQGCEIDTYFVHTGLGSFNHSDGDGGLVNNSGTHDPFYPSGINVRTAENAKIAVRPLFVSGPNLECYFSGVGWDYSLIGKEEAEPVFEKDDCGNDGGSPAKKYPANHPDWKMEWKSTGIRKTFSGNCPLGFSGVDFFDRTPHSCECGDPCEDCKGDWGTLKLICSCEDKCVKSFEQGLKNPNVCSDGHGNAVSDPVEGCEGTYGISFNIGKYVGVSVTPPLESGYGIYNVAPVPLSLQGEEKELKEDLVLWWQGWISDVISPNFWSGAGYAGGMGMGNGSMPFYPNYDSAELELVTYINRSSIDHAMEYFQGLDDSVVKYEDKEVGTLKLVCEEWNTTTPIYVIRRIKKETSCKTNFQKDPVSNSSNGLYTSTFGAPYLTCEETPDDYYCCDDGGCNGVKDSDPCCDEQFCGINYPCAVGWVIGGQKGKCDDNSNTTCTSEPTEGDENDLLCGCCGCHNEEDEDCEECEKGPICKVYKLTEDFQELACYGQAHEEDKLETTLNLTITFKLFTEME